MFLLSVSKRHGLVLVALAGIVAGVAATAYGVTATTSGNWVTPSNWGGALPTTGDEAIINAGVTLAINAGDSAVAFDIRQNGTLNIGGGTLTLDGNTFQGTTWFLGTGSNNAVVNQTGGTVLIGNTNIRHLSIAPDGGNSSYTISGGNATVTGNVFLGTNSNYAGGNSTSTLTVNGGQFTVNGGVLMGSTDAAANATVNLSAGTLVSSMFSTVAGTKTFNFNGGTLKAGGSNTAFMEGLTNAYVQSPGAVIETNGYDITIKQSLVPFSGSTGGLTKNGAGSLTLKGANTYTGGTAVTGGTLAIAAASALAPGAITLSNDATLAFKAPAGSLTSLSLVNKTATANYAAQPAGNAVDGNTGTRWETGGHPSSTPLWLGVDLGADYTLGQVGIDWERANGWNYTVRVATQAQHDANSNPATWPVAATIKGNGTFGVWTDYTLDAPITGRYLAIVSTASNWDPNSIPTNSMISIWELRAATVAASPSTAYSVSSLTGGPSTSLNLGPTTNTVSVGDANDTIFAGKITGAGAFTKTGSGTLTLSGTAHDLTGATTVNAGKLNLTGALPATSTVAVNNTATLGGTGTVAGTTTVYAGAHLAPSLSAPGTVSALHITGNLELKPNSLLDFNFQSSGTSDQVLGSGANTLTVPAVGAGFITLNLAQAGGLDNGVYTLLGNFGSIAGNASPASAFVVNTSPLTSKVYTFASDGSTNITLSIACMTAVTWTGGSSGPGDDYWSTAANWGGAAPVSGYGLTFDGTTRLHNYNDIGGSPILTRITFASGAGAFTLDPKDASYSIRLRGNITNSSSNDQTINLPMDIDAPRIVDTGAQKMTLGGSISGLGALAKSNSGTLLLSGVNTFQGGVELDAGTLQAGGPSVGTPSAITSGPFGTGTLVLKAGTVSSDNTTPRTVLNAVTLDADMVLGDVTHSGTLDFQGPVMLTGSRQLTVNSPVTISGPIGGAGFSLTKAGGDTLTLSGSNTFNGGTTIANGTLQLGHDNGLGTGGLTVNAGTCDLNTHSAAIASLAGAGGTIRDQSSTPGTTTLTVNQGTATTYAGAFQNGTNGRVVGLTMNGPGGTLTLTGSNTHGGTTTVQAGTLRMNAGAMSANSALSVAGGLLDTQGNTASVPGISVTGGTIQGSGTLTSAAPLNLQSGTVAAPLTGPTLATKTDSGTLLVSTPLSYSGATVISAGTVKITAALALPAGTAVYYTFNDASNIGKDSGPNGSNLKTAAGAPAYSANGKFGGALYLNGGSIMDSASGAFPTGVPTGNSAYTISTWINPDGGGGWVSWGNGADSQCNSFRMNGNNGVWNYWWNNDFGADAGYDLVAGAPPSGWHYLVATYDPSLPSNQRKIYIDGVLKNQGDGGGANIQGTNFRVGTTTANENFTGYLDDLLIANTAFDAATIAGAYSNGFALTPNMLPTTTALQIAAGATLDLNGSSQTVASLSDSGGSGGAILLGGATLTTGDAADTTFSGTISGGGNLVKQGSGNFTLAGASTFTGDTRVNAGTLTLGHSQAMGGSTFDSDSPGTLSFGTLTAATFGGLKGAGNLTLTNITPAAVALTVGGNNQSTTYSGALSGSGGLIKSGTGTLTLAGPNTYSGVTTVQAGTLAAGASSTLSPNSAVAVSGGNLDVQGNNTVAGLQLVSGAVNGTGGVLTSTTNFDLRSGSISANLAGSVGLTKGTTGTVTLTGTNTYTGVTAINGGRLVAAAPASIGGAVTLSNTATLAIWNGGMGPQVDLVGKTAAASSGPIAGYQAPQAVDGNTGTRWWSGDNSVPAWIYVDMGANYTLDQVGIAWERANGRDYTIHVATQDQFNASNNPNNWPVAKTVTNNQDYSQDGSVWSNYTLDSPATGRYLGIYCTASNWTPDQSDLMISIWEIHAFQAPTNYAIASLAGDAGTTVDLAANHLTVGDGNNTTYNGTIIGPGSLTKTGSGTLTLAGTNTYGGSTNVTQGMLLATKPASLPGYNAPSRVSVSGSATLAVNGDPGNWILGDDVPTLMTNATFAAGSKLGIEITGTNANSCAADDLGGGGFGLLKLGGGTLSLSGTGAYTGGTTVNEGTLAVTSPDALTARQNLSIASGGHVVLASGLSHAISLGGLTITSGAGGAGTVGSGTWDVGSGQPFAASQGPATPTPEPGTLALLAAAVVAGLIARRRAKA